MTGCVPGFLRTALVMCHPSTLTECAEGYDTVRRALVFLRLLREPLFGLHNRRSSFFRSCSCASNTPYFLSLRFCSLSSANCASNRWLRVTHSLQYSNFQKETPHSHIACLAPHHGGGSLHAIRLTAFASLVAEDTSRDDVYLPRCIRKEKCASSKPQCCEQPYESDS